VQSGWANEHIAICGVTCIEVCDQAVKF
jgi:hypothetical protein